jgi:outer membrane protein
MGAVVVFAVTSISARAGQATPSHRSERLRAPSAVPEPIKIGYVDARLVLNESEEGKALTRQLEKESASKRKELDHLKGEIQTGMQELEAKHSILSPSAYEQARAALTDKIQDYEKRAAEADTALASALQAANEQLLAKLRPFVQKLAADEGYTYVLDRSAVLVAPTEHDLTHQLLRKVNEAYRTLQHTPTRSKGD